MKRTIYHYSRPFKGGVREGLLLHYKSENRREGWGEVAPLPGFSQESLSEALSALISGDHTRFPSTAWGVAAALLDLKSPLDIPSIPVRTLHEDKIKIGHLSLEKALALFKEKKGSGVDMNRQWSLDEALSFAKAFPHLDYFEEPLKEGIGAEHFHYPVALDESLREKTLPPYPNIKMYVIKPTLLGYPLPSIRKGVDFILSSSYESELGIYQIAKLAYRLKLPLLPMGLGTCHLFEDSLFEEEPMIKNGHLHFPQKWKLKKDKVQVAHDECI
ncbi:MAG: hypothetical protein KDK60_00730 [Chlamydiia bacterium]|nr:hypothetical protein [Chlamydiia bacterium]